MTDDTTKSATIINISAALERAKQAADQNAPTPADLMAELERDAQAARSRALAAAEPAIPDEDVRMLILDTTGDRAPLRAVQEYMRGSKALAVLHGDVGVGKTLAACWALAARGGHFVSAMDVARIFTSFSEEARRAKLMSAFVLVVDDVGQELDPAKFGPCLTELINRRRSGGKRTILTSNLSPRALRERYPDRRLWSRVSQCVHGRGFEGADLRKGGE